MNNKEPLNELPDDSNSGIEHALQQSGADCFISDPDIINAIFKSPADYCVEVTQYPKDFSRWCVTIIKRDIAVTIFAISLEREKDNPDNFDPADLYRTGAIIMREDQEYEHAEHFAGLWSWTYQLKIFFNRRDGKDGNTGYIGYSPE